MTHEALVPVGSPLDPRWIVSGPDSSVGLIKDSKLVIGYTSWIAFLSGKVLS